ncbi:MAG: hydrogen peroxide-inducible genes activator [Gammaproteobacteria bacterium]|nr:hydrogen peroxide-inducible genes activator [Gammaproteobacteria bacterium]
MTLTELRYIAAVARERHFGRAAEACFVSQPTLSVAVKKLEDELGVALFERSKTEVSLTPAGERIVAQARKVLMEAEEVKALAQASRDPLAGVLRVGAIFTIGPYVFPRLVPGVKALAPAMPLQIQEDFTANLRRRLREGEVDAILIALPFNEPEVEVLPLFDEDFVVLVPEEHEWAARREVPPAELAGQPLLMLGQGHCFRDQVFQQCPACVANEPGSTTTLFEGSSLETIRQMVASGYGITVLPRIAAEPALASHAGVATRPFAAPAPGRSVALAWRRSFPRQAAIAVLVKALRGSGLDGVSWRDA